MAYLILKYTRRGEAIYEPFGGGASGLIPALRLGRHWRGSEANTKVWSAAYTRVREATRNMMAEGVDIGMCSAFPIESCSCFLFVGFWEVAN